MIDNYETLLGLGALACGIGYLSKQIADYYYAKKMLPVLGIAELIFETAPENSGTEGVTENFLNDSNTIAGKILFAGERMAAKKHLESKG